MFLLARSSSQVGRAGPDTRENAGDFDRRGPLGSAMAVSLGRFLTAFQGYFETFNY